jgi:hypothetical protein
VSAAGERRGYEKNSVVGAVSSVAGDERWLLTAGRGLASRVEADVVGLAARHFRPDHRLVKEIIG